MRLIPLCLLGLLTLLMTAPQADASPNRAESRAAKVTKPSAARAPSRPAVAAPQRAASRPPAAARATTRQVAGPARGAQPRAAAVRGGASRQTAKASSRGNARRETVVAQRPANVTDRGARLASWQAGLPAVSGDQRDCPTGTMSTLARGHDDIVRCMPL